MRVRWSSGPLTIMQIEDKENDKRIALGYQEAQDLSTFIYLRVVRRLLDSTASEGKPR
jgi:hypothetical protein